MLVRVTRRWWLLAGFGTPLWACVAAPALAPRLDGDELRVSAPEMQILTGKPLEKLLNGATVGFAFQLTLVTDPRSLPFVRTIERFVVSYDLWEEKFSVARVGRMRRSVSHLSASAAQMWCLDNLTLSTAGLPPNRPFWLRLEVRADDTQGGLGVLDEPGINLTRLVEIFSRPPLAQQVRWQAEAGPLLLANVRKSESLRR